MRVVRFFITLLVWRQRGKRAARRNLWVAEGRKREKTLRSPACRAYLVTRCRCGKMSHAPRLLQTRPRSLAHDTAQGTRIPAAKSCVFTEKVRKTVRNEFGMNSE